MDSRSFFIIIVAESMTARMLGDIHRVPAALLILKSKRTRKTTVIQIENTEIQYFSIWVIFRNTNNFKPLTNISELKAELTQEDICTTML